MAAASEPKAVVTGGGGFFLGMTDFFDLFFFLGCVFFFGGFEDNFDGTIMILDSGGSFW